MAIFRATPPNHFSLPRRINRLGELAYNLWWTWNLDSQRLFLRIDRDLWDRIDHNPIKFLRQVDRARLNSATNNRYYLDFYDRMIHAFDQYMEEPKPWFLQHYEKYSDQLIA